MADTAQTTTPAPPDLLRAVVLAYRERRQAGAWENEAWLAARAMVQAHRPDLAEWQAGDLAQRVLVWAAEQEVDWIWAAGGRMSLSDPMPANESGTAPHGHEAVGEADTVVLVVDDDPAVRRLLVRQLQELGYQAVEAGTGVAALELLRQGIRIDLLLSDIIMPGGVNGGDLAVKARGLRPDLKMLFTTGFADSALAVRGQLMEGMRLLRKPFRLANLAMAVRAALGDAA